MRHYESEVEKIISEALSVYDEFNDKRETVIKEIVAAIVNHLGNKFQTGAVLDP